MPSEQERVIRFFGELASAVVHAIKEGTDDDRKRLIKSLEEMNAGMPAVSEDTANAREFLTALISLLIGEPESPEGLVEPYRGIYERIIQAVLARHAGHEHGDGHGPVHAHHEGEDAELAMKEFLTQLAASTVLVMKKGTDEDKEKLAQKLGEVLGAIPAEESGPRSLVEAFISILKGRPIDKDALVRPYSNIYTKVLHETGMEKA